MSALGRHRWQAVSPYLDEALEMTGEEQARLLASLQATEPSVAADLEALLAERDALNRGGFLEDPPSPQASLVGAVVGSYTLRSLIGEGGMGSVWLAERSDGRFEGKAAVKLLNVSLVGRSGEERFIREGHILARLNHPAVAHLIDAGVSTFGQPYLVLERVEGEHIDRYCERLGLDVAERVRLFLQVLEAVAHAHANLIVHRDIKPSNVLVRGDGRVKLLDFGIAKLLETEGATDSAVLTADGSRLLTPAYAAPEQMTGAAVTTATDVYSLGVLLYVLLTGRHPGGLATSAPAELLKAIVETTPAKPSEAVSSAAARRALRGDLDNIVAKALKKDPGERYASVVAFAGDLQAHLANQPVSARPDRWTYRASKFARRHAGALAAGAAVILAIAVLVGFYTTRLTAERDRARLEAEKAASVSALLTGLLTGADPYGESGGATPPTVRDLLDAGARRVDRELANQPELRAEMLTVIGRVYQRLNLNDRARVMLEQALALGRSASPEHPRVAETLNDLGVLLREAGDRKAALPILEESLAMRRRLLGTGHRDVAVTLVEIARTHADAGDARTAEPLFRDALAIRRKTLGNQHQETATSLNELGLLLWQNGDTAAAEPLLRENVAITRDASGGTHPNVATSLNNLGLLFLSQARAAEAEPLFREAVGISRTALGPRHSNTAVQLGNLAAALKEQGKHVEALGTAHDAIAALDTTDPANRSLHAAFLGTLARTHLDRRDPAAAELHAREMLTIRQSLYDDDHWLVAQARSILGAALSDLHRFEEAESLLLSAVGTIKPAPGAQGREYAATRQRLVALYEAMGKPGQADTYRARPGQP
jgi:tetratricopeptide (TPR) repeat protein